MQNICLSELNTLIQFFAALYLTITIDSLIFKRFWTPNSYDIVKDVLAKFDFAISTPAIKPLMENVKKIAINNDKQSRQRGGYFLLWCIYLLIYFLFEHGNNNVENYKIHLFLTISFSFIVYIVGIFCWKKTLHILCSFVGVIAIASLSILGINHINLLKIFFTNLINEFPNLVVIEILLVLIVPIILRLIINFLKSTVYIRYLTFNLSDEWNRSTNTLEGLENKEQSSCDEAYKDAYSSFYFSQDQSVDSVYTKFTEILQDRIKNIINVGQWDLLKFYFSRKYNEIPKFEKKSDFDDKILEKKLPDSANTNKLEEHCKKYAQTNGVRLDTYCAKNNLDPTEFRKYRNAWLKNSKS